MTDDEDLMPRVAKGDMDAFEDLVERHQQGALNTAYHFLGDRAQAEDVAQEAFLRVLAAAERYEPRAAFRTYLFTVIWRLCVDRHRRTDPAPLESVAPRESPAEGPPQATFRRERAELVQSALAELPSRQRMAAVLKYFEEMSYNEIAEVLDCSTQAVDSLLSRARARLREALGDVL
jgi:RNA polymerase sigma-70 factor (ECF subfamily)